MQAAHLATILLLSLSSNLDNIGVGVSYGVRKISIPFGSNVLIAAVTSSGTLLSILLGQTLYLFISPRMAGVLGGSIIIAAGLWVILQDAVMHRGREPQQDKQPVSQTGATRFGFRQIVSILNNPIIADRGCSGHIDLKEATALALGLTINNIPNGVAAGILGINPALMTSSVLCFSIITIWLGISGGHFGFRWLGQLTGVVSGLILIGVGVYAIAF